jgi:hypothetical protein
VGVDERSFIAILLDRSGSMETMRDDAVAGFNAFVADQRALPGEATLLLAQFDDRYDMVYDAIPLAEVPPLTAEVFVPRGATALLDAIGRTLNDVRARLARLPADRRPSRVAVVVITDGRENSSQEFTAEMVRRMIETHRSVHGWEILFLGTSEQAIEDSRALGVDASHTTSFSPTAVGMRRAFEAISQTIRTHRAGGPAVFDDESRKRMN